ncbi:MAG: tripartite tricarboxylate transporter substrate binding protein [Desulfobacteraceae bacterium]|nr:MAG: tripartite tricarboxylate transporter substrate binding protein [Desulfobacteraceae bacterium]
MRRFHPAIHLLVLFMITFFASQSVHAQAYPNKPIQLIISIPAGGGGDVNARLIIDELAKNVGAQIIPTNKPGASDTVGTDALVKSKNDGYTIGYTSSAAMVYFRVTNPDAVHYDPIKDFDHLGLHTLFPLAVAVQADSPWKSFKELVEYAKKNPGKLRVSTAGVGSTSNFDVQITQSLTGAEFTHVPFKGGEAVVTALLGGHVEVSYDIVGKFLPHVEAGKLRILLASTKTPVLKDVPTLKELGYPRDLLSGWHGFFAPAGLPAEAKKVLLPAVEKAVNNPEAKAKIEKIGYVVNYKSPEEFKKLINEDFATAKEIAAKLNLNK